MCREGIISGVPIRRKTIQVGPIKIDTWFFYDPNSDSWLSLHLENLVFARNATGVLGFLRTVNGIVTTSTYGPLLLQNSRLVYVTGKSDSSVLNREIHVWNAGTDVATLAWGGLETSGTFDADLSAGSLSVEIQSSGIGNSPNLPIVMVGYRWRY